MTIQAAKLCKKIRLLILVDRGEAITLFRRGLAGCSSFFMVKCSTASSKVVVMLKVNGENGEKVGWYRIDLYAVLYLLNITRNC